MAVKHYMWAERYEDCAECEERLEALRRLDNMLEEVLAEADALGVDVELDNYALWMEISELKEQVEDFENAEIDAEADKEWLCREYERSVL